jgi:serine-type D-Ala-D-Ala carboxypeptidase (penicillin-binding protein 5/6)
MLTKIAAVTVLGVIALLIPGQTLNKIEQRTQTEVLGTSTSAQSEQEATQLKAAPEFARQIALPELTAKSAIAYDASSGAILYSKNFDEKLPVASLTKLMTAVVAMEYLDYNQVVTVQKDDIRVIGTNMGLLPEERITVNNLLRGLLISSSNDASKVLARSAAGSESKFVALMNQKARNLGMIATNFNNPVGLDASDNYSTAHDLIKIVDEFAKNPMFNQIVQIHETEVSSVDNKITHRLRTTNKLLLENANVTGIKTGFTSIAKGNLIIRVKENSGEIITIVLGSDDREADTRKLIDWVVGVYKW